MERPRHYDSKQWEKMLQPESQERIRNNLETSVRVFLDTAPDEDGGYPTRMAEVLSILNKYAREEHRENLIELISGALSVDEKDDPYRFAIYAIVAGVLRHGERMLRNANQNANAIAVSMGESPPKDYPGGKEAQEKIEKSVQRLELPELELKAAKLLIESRLALFALIQLQISEETAESRRQGMSDFQEDLQIAMETL